MFRKKHDLSYKNVKKLEETIKLKEKEIDDIKNLASNTLSEIKKLNESNYYGNSVVYKRKISELCTDTIYKLVFNFSKKEIKNESRTISSSQSKNSSTNT